MKKRQKPQKSLLLILLIYALLQTLNADEAILPGAEAKPAVKGIEDQRRDTLRFGTETEIASLIQTLKNENVDYLDNELIEIAQKTFNRAILPGIFGFFSEAEKSGLENRAIKAVTERDAEANETVMAAIDYLGKVKASQAVDCLKELINSRETRFLNNAFRALGRAVSEEEADSAAAFLLDYYDNRSPAEENKREIITALGETGSSDGISFLSGVIKNNEERPVLRMAALESLAKIGDEEGRDAVIAAVSSTDPNVRSSAVAALYPFSGEEVENAILEAFRDSYYRTRMGAAQAAGMRKLQSAIQYLRYRAENDDVPSVKDEAIKALGAMNTSEAIAVLDSFFRERKNSDRVRILAADMLLKNDAGNYGSPVLVEREEAKSKNQTQLYNGFIRVMTTAKAPAMENLAKHFIAGGGVIEKSLALDLILNNKFLSMEGEVRSLLDEKIHSASIARKAQRTLEKLGLDSAKPN
jgi:HEAT repeat protein